MAAEHFIEPAQTVPIPTAAEMHKAVFGPETAVPIPSEDQASDDMAEPLPQPAAVVAAEPERPPLRKAALRPIKKKSHWIFYPLYLLLLILIGYLGFHAFQAIQYARLETGTVAAAGSAAPGVSAKSESAASGLPIDGYRRIWERNLFNIDQTRDSEPPTKIALDKITLAKKDLGLELVGTVVADNPQMSRAIIDNRKTREQEAYREGDKAGEVRIKKIYRNNVVITTAEGDELLTVEIKESTKRSAAYTPAQDIGSQSATTPQATGSRQTPARTLSLNLKRDEVAAAFTDMDGFVKELRIVP